MASPRQVSRHQPPRDGAPAGGAVAKIRDDAEAPGACDPEPGAAGLQVAAGEDRRIVRHQPSGAAGRSWNSSRLPARISRIPGGVPGDDEQAHGGIVRPAVPLRPTRQVESVPAPCAATTAGRTACGRPCDGPVQQHSRARRHTSGTTTASIAIPVAPTVSAVRITGFASPPVARPISRARAPCCPWSVPRCRRPR